MEARHLSWCLVSNQSNFSLSFFPLYLAITSVLPYIVLCDFVYVSCGLVKEIKIRSFLSHRIIFASVLIIFFFNVLFGRVWKKWGCHEIQEGEQGGGLEPEGGSVRLMAECRDHLGQWALLYCEI